jgi:serine/threonine protein phosphatase PrpC
MNNYALDVAGLSDRGIKRDHNEDTWAPPPDELAPEQIAAKGRLYLVADGVGGHQAGDVASAMAAEIIQQAYYEDDSADVVNSLTSVIQLANTEIHTDAEATPERQGMGTTVTAVVLRDDDITVANVGDSRTYLIRDGELRQLTLDHSWIEEQVRAGAIAPEDAVRHPHRNIITRSLGNRAELQVDIFQEPVQVGDSILLCSDGLTNVVQEEEIGHMLNQGRKARQVVHDLVEMAKERGAPDNVTAVLLNIRPARQRRVPALIALGLLVGLILVGAIFVFMRWWNSEIETPGNSANTAFPSSSVATVPTALPTSLSTPALGAQQTSSTPSAPPRTSPTPADTLASTPGTSNAMSLSTLSTPTATPLPLDASLPKPELLSPEVDAAIPWGETILFSWNWQYELKEAENWHFVFVLKSGQQAPALAERELPLSQRGLAFTQPLPPGEYWWTLTLVGTYRKGEPAESRLRIVEARPAPSAPRSSPSPTPN